MLLTHFKVEGAFPFYIVHALAPILIGIQTHLLSHLPLLNRQTVNIIYRHSQMQETILPRPWCVTLPGAILC